MSLLNSYICPRCGNHFPLFLKPSITVRRGFFSAPHLKCQNCRQLCRAKIHFKSALIVWPITAAYMGLMFYSVRTDFVRNLYKNAWGLYFFLSFLFILMPLFLGIRRGFKLVKVQDDKKSHETRLHKSMPVIASVLFLGLFGYYTNDWSNVVIGIVVAIIAYSFYNYFRRKK
jgi:hypothetical protein